MEKYDAAFIECVKEKDLELFTILNDYHNFLLDENFIQDTSNWQLQHLREQLTNGDISIDRGLFVEKMFDNGFEGWFYFKPDKRSLLANCLVGAKKDWKRMQLNQKFINIVCCTILFQSSRVGVFGLALKQIYR